MPVAFDKCVKAGGKVRTVKLSDGKYKHVCYLGNKSYSGHVKVRKNKYTEALASGTKR